MKLEIIDYSAEEQIKFPVRDVSFIDWEVKPDIFTPLTETMMWYSPIKVEFQHIFAPFASNNGQPSFYIVAKVKKREVANV